MVDEHVLDAIGVHETALDDTGLRLIRNPAHGAHVDLGHRVILAE